MSQARRALCVCHDTTVGDTVAAALASAGLVVEHTRVVPPTTDGVALIVVDAAARKAAGDSLRSARVPVVVVGDSLDDDGLIALMLDAPVSHLVEDPADRDVAITSAKLASGDHFGLEKYVAPTAPVYERAVADEAARVQARAEVCAWAESSGARTATVHRVANVVDELLMNALGAGSRHACLRWAADEQTLAISVGDARGALSQRDVILHVQRAKGEKGRPKPTSPSGNGAGLGLYLVLANVASLVVNVTPGQRTEVVCLFSLARGVRPSPSRVRSLHVFAT